MRLPFTEQQWAAAVDESGRVQNFKEILDQIAEKGMEATVRSEVWPFLLGVYSADSTYADRQAQRDSLSQAYKSLIHDCEDLEAALEESVARTGVAGVSHPAHIEEQIPSRLVQFATIQRIIVLDAIRTDFTGAAGVSRLPNSPSSGGLTALLSSWRNSRENGSRSSVWISRLARSTLDDATHLSPEARRQAVRLIALLSAYSVHDPETGYCQGMSDLAATFTMLLDDDVLAFWCFERLMRRARTNFAHDDSGIFAHLRTLGALLERTDSVLFHKLRQVGAVDCQFAYRMIIVLFKRDLSLEHVLLLWEMVWADALLARHERLESGWDLRRQDSLAPASAQVQSAGNSDGEFDLFMYFVAAVVVSHRRRVLDECHEQEDVLRMFNGVKVALWDCLSRARLIRQQCLELDKAGAK